MGGGQCGGVWCTSSHGDVVAVRVNVGGDMAAVHVNVGGDVAGYGCRWGGVAG